MGRLSRLRFWPVLLLPGVLPAADGWTQLKRGMTADETRAALGKPLLLSEGYGFAVWIYDHGTEVVFYDKVIAWTAPGPRGPVASPGEQWSFYQAAPGSVPASPPEGQRATRDRPGFFLPVETTAFRYQPRR